MPSDCPAFVTRAPHFVVAAVLAALLLSACSSSTASDQAAGKAVHDTSLLRSALLPSADLDGFSEQPASYRNGDGIAGCPVFAQVLSRRLAPGENSAELFMQRGISGPYVDEVLLSEPAQASSRDLTEYAHELSACTSPTIGTGVRQIQMTATPVDFAPGAAAIRVDGVLGDVLPADGYLVLGRVDATTLIGFMYLQFGSASDQPAYKLYSTASATAAHTLDRRGPATEGTSRGT